MRTVASSGSVEPKHWYPACTRNSAYAGCGPKIRGQHPVRAGCLLPHAQVPQSAPNETDGSDYRDNRRQQGAKPVRFSNGQQLT